jgi:hypothetical protein
MLRARPDESVGSAGAGAGGGAGEEVVTWEGVGLGAGQPAGQCGASAPGGAPCTGDRARVSYARLVLPLQCTLLVHRDLLKTPPRHASFLFARTVVTRQTQRRRCALWSKRVQKGSARFHLSHLHRLSACPRPATTMRW